MLAAWLAHVVHQSNFRRDIETITYLPPAKSYWFHFANGSNESIIHCCKYRVDLFNTYIWYFFIIRNSSNPYGRYNNLTFNWLHEMYMKIFRWSLPQRRGVLMFRFYSNIWINYQRLGPLIQVPIAHLCMYSRYKRGKCLFFMFLVCSCGVGGVSRARA